MNIAPSVAAHQPLIHQSSALPTASGVLVPMPRQNTNTKPKPCMKNVLLLGEQPVVGNAKEKQLQIFPFWVCNTHPET